MNSDVTSNIPPTPPKTAGRKKIKIQRIEDSRNRQVTFLKRKNGLLKKAMELGVLCDCEVAVVIFNLSNGKLFEYSSVEPETVLQKYATYSGPSERRRKDRFFELAASKGTSNIPVNEPRLAKAAMDAAAAAVLRPRPFHKFKNTEKTEGEEGMYYNGRKLSSGESPGNAPLPSPTNVPPIPSLPATAIGIPNTAPMPIQAQLHPPGADLVPVQTVPSSSERTTLGQLPHINNTKNQTFQSEQPAMGRGGFIQNQIANPGGSRTQANGQRPPQLPMSMSNTSQMPGFDFFSARSSGLGVTPRFTADVPIPSPFTPNTAGRHLSAVLGINTPTPMNAYGSKMPFFNPGTGGGGKPGNIPQWTPRPVEPERMLNTDSLESQYVFKTPRPEKQIPEVQNDESNCEKSNPKDDIKPDKGHPNFEKALSPGTEHPESSKNPGGTETRVDNADALKSDPAFMLKTPMPQEKAMERRSFRVKPNLRVTIPNPNRDDQTGLASSLPSSGLFPAATNNGGDVPGLGPPLASVRLPSLSPFGPGWPGWHSLGSGDRDGGPIPITPFLNDTMDSFGEVVNTPAFGGGHPFTLPSPTNAGLIPSPTNAGLMGINGIPLTPRYLGFDPLLSARADLPSALPGKRTFDQAFRNDSSNQNPK